MAPKLPASDPAITPVKAATFIAGIEVPGHGVLSSVNVERHKDLKLSVGDLGLLIDSGGRTTLVPFANLKAVYL